MTNTEAIEILKKEIDGIPDDLDTGDFTNAVRLAIKSLENARPHGKWIYHENWENDGECPYECSKCGTCYDYDMNFCGNCGAYMEADNEENE